MTITQKTLTVTLAVLAFSLTGLTGSCTPAQTDAKQDAKEDPQQDPQQDPQEDTVDLWQWENGYPKGVQVESFSWTIKGKKAKGFIATVDFNANPNLRFNCAKAYPNGRKKKTSEQFAYFATNHPQDSVVLAFNAGYFSGTTSVSPIFSQGDVICPATRIFNWPADEAEVYRNPLYTPRACLGQFEDGHFEMQWVYCTDKFMEAHCAYPDISLLGNNEKTETFRDTPPTDTTAGAYPWQPYEGVGGGPMLIRDSVNVAEDCFWYECLNAGGTDALNTVNRTAVGMTADGKLIFIVVDGRSKNGSAGITLPALADKFLEMGCVSAMNFDGGGSSTIVGPDGQVMNYPSDNSGERAVVSVMIISEKKQ